MSATRNGRLDSAPAAGPAEVGSCQASLDVQPSTACTWLAEFAERTPVELGHWLDVVEGDPSRRTRSQIELDHLDAPPAVSSLVECTEAALGGALSNLGRHRPSAFDLLTAGAFLGYACEAALRGSNDPAPLLWAVARQLAREDDP